MFRSHSTQWIVALVVIAIIAFGITIGMDNHHPFTVQTAVSQAATGQASDEDFKYLERINRAFIEIVNRAKPAVVQITTTKRVSMSGNKSPFDFFGDDDFFHYWFGVPRDRQQPQERGGKDEEPRNVPGGLGSGVIVSKDGYILTNNHVIEGADDITVILPNGRDYKAKVVGRDSGEQGTDLAILKIDGKDLPVLPFGDSDALEVGEWVIAIGSPFGLAQTATRGMVSAKGRSNSDLNVVDYADFIQTDAAINRGNSGGALINIRGELIGINTAIATGGGFSQGNVGVGFAIPSNLAKRVMKDLIEKGEVERGWLGVSIQPINYDLAEKLKLGEPHGALISDVGPDTPAQKAGIQRGDVVVEFNHTPIRDMNHLRYVVASTEIGKTVDVKILRKGQEKGLKVKLVKKTNQTIAQSGLRSGPQRFVPGNEGGEVFGGLHVQDLTPELAERYKYQPGETGVIVVDVDGPSPAASAGINAGDLIQEVEFTEVANVNEYSQQLKAVKDKSKVTLYVRNPNGGGRYVTLRDINLDDK